MSTAGQDEGNTAAEPIASGDVETEEHAYAALEAPAPPAPLPPPTLDPLLPFHLLHPETFERLIAEIVYLRRDNRGARFYGRRGQKQYGLDIVENMNDETRTLYQVKRYQDVTPAQLRSAVTDFAGDPRGIDSTEAPRRFDPKRFVVVTSAQVNTDTANVDEIVQLQDDYRGDLEIEVWGAEDLTSMLRDMPGLVAATFGGAWAEAVCGFAPSPLPPGAPHPHALVEGPAQVLGIETLIADADASVETDPAHASQLYARAAAELHGTYPGHAALMRAHQARSARAAGLHAEAFEIEFTLALARLHRGEEINASASRLIEHANAAGGHAPAKAALLSAVALWHEQGTNLTGISAALSALNGHEDLQVAALCCLALEQALVDGLYETDPPLSIFAEVDGATPAQLDQLRRTAARLHSTDPVIRARLRCAVADASLRFDSSDQEVDVAYRDLGEDAASGRMQQAGGLVAARAAYAYATHGNPGRAENYWRLAVIQSSERGFYGDVRYAMRSARLARIQHVNEMPSDINTVLEALPNKHVILESRYDLSAATHELIQNNDVIQALGSARRRLWQTRASGHFQDEQLAWQQLGHVLKSVRPAAAVECFVRAGAHKLAAELAAGLPEQCDTWRLSTSPVRRIQAAAVSVAAAQLALIPDADLEALTLDLVAIADPHRISSFSANPEGLALDAIASLGVRIPMAAVDAILELVRATLESAPTRRTGAANLLVQTYWADKARRPEITDALIALLRSGDAPPNLWDLVSNMPIDGRAPLTETVTSLAAEGDARASRTLLAWRHEPSNLQLVARRASAALLRKTVDPARVSLTTEASTVVDLLVGLMDADAEMPIDASQLVAALAPPVGDVIVTKARVGAPGETPLSPPPSSEDPNTVDAIATLAAGSRNELLAAVAAKLIELAEDSAYGAGPRQQVIVAYARLTAYLPPELGAEHARRLLAICEDPNLSDDDRFELEHDDDLSRFRISGSVERLTPIALVTAARAFAAAVGAGASIEKDSAFRERLLTASLGVLAGKPSLAAFGARAIVSASEAVPEMAPYVTMLLAHPSAEVRQWGAKHTALNESLILRTASDVDARVRAALASRRDSLPAATRDALQNDPDIDVRRAAQNATD